MEKELRNPPASEEWWRFTHQEGEGYGCTVTYYREKARTAWLAVKKRCLSFQNCHSFEQEQP